MVTIKRKSLIHRCIALAMVIGALIIVSLTPGVALADDHVPSISDTTSTSKTFNASGSAVIAGYENFSQAGLVQYTNGEEVVCEPLSSSLRFINGSEFDAIVDTTVVLSLNGTLQGSLQGDFTLTTDDGSITGKISGRISGHWNYCEGVTDVEDSGTFASVDGDGSLAGASLSGAWSADLTYDVSLGTYAGPITINGTYQLLGVGAVANWGRFNLKPWAAVR